MSKKDDEIARLTAELAKAQARVADAEAKAISFEKKLNAERAKRETLEALLLRLPEMIELTNQSLDTLKSLGDDIPQAMRDAWVQTLQSMKDSFIQLTKDRAFQRLNKKGSEKIGKRGKKPSLEEQITTAKNAVDKAERDLKRKNAQLQKALDAMNEAATAKNAENPSSLLDNAAAGIANTPDPEAKEFPTRPSEGRQVPDEKIKATEESANCPEPPNECPDCHRTQGIISGRVHAEPLRTLSNRLNAIADFIARTSQHHYCTSCHKAFYTSTGDDVPSLPGRQMGQWLIVKAVKLYCLGIPLYRLHKMLFGEQPHFGKETLYTNLHDWALDTGKPLLDALATVLLSQHTLLMDETTFTVLQSQGLGICETPDEKDQRKKDYIAVQCSTFSEQHRCFRFIYLGGRSNDKINEALKDAHPQVLVTDGYGSYASFCRGEGRPIAQNCCAHLRRAIIDALKIPALNKHLFETEPEKAVMKAKALCDNGSPAFYLCMVLEAFTKIYGNEASLTRGENETDEHFFQRVKESRDRYARPLMDHIDTIMCELAKKLTRKTGTDSYESVDKTRQAGSAVVYYMNRRKNFRVFLDDPMVPPDSNAVEQAVRPVTVLRKACNFKQSREHMDSLCIMLSLYETARANGITDFEQWLHDYSRAFFVYRANKTLTRKVKESVSPDAALNAKLMAFDDKAGEGFDFSRFYPWKYKNPET